jgi:hypothetical protein
MRLIGKVFVVVLAVTSWMWIAPKVWPAHPLVFTLIVMAVAAVVAFLIWPAEIFPKT